MPEEVQAHFLTIKLVYCLQHLLVNHPAYLWLSVWRTVINSIAKASQEDIFFDRKQKVSQGRKAWKIFSYILHKTPEASQYFVVRAGMFLDLVVIDLCANKTLCFGQ